jgi:hypothetical protein
MARGYVPPSSVARGRARLRQIIRNSLRSALTTTGTTTWWGKSRGDEGGDNRAARNSDQRAAARRLSGIRVRPCSRSGRPRQRRLRLCGLRIGHTRGEGDRHRDRSGVQVSARNRQTAVLTTRRDQDLLVLQLLSRSEEKRVRWYVNGGDGRVDESDVLRLIPLGGPDIPSLQARPGRRRPGRFLTPERIDRPKRSLSQRRRRRPSPGPESSTSPRFRPWRRRSRRSNAGPY